MKGGLSKTRQHTRQTSTGDQHAHAQPHNPRVMCVSCVHACWQHLSCAAATIKSNHLGPPRLCSFSWKVGAAGACTLAVQRTPAVPSKILCGVVRPTQDNDGASHFRGGGEARDNTRQEHDEKNQHVHHSACHAELREWCCCSRGSGVLGEWPPSPTPS